MAARLAVTFVRGSRLDIARLISTPRKCPSGAASTAASPSHFRNSN